MIVWLSHSYNISVISSSINLHPCHRSHYELTKCLLTGIIKYFLICDAWSDGEIFSIKSGLNLRIYHWNSEDTYLYTKLLSATLPSKFHPADHRLRIPLWDISDEFWMKIHLMGWFYDHWSSTLSWLINFCY